MVSSKKLNNLSTLFKATRKFNGLLQSEFAAILGTTQGTISKIESGNMAPDLDIWFQFLKSFNVVDPYCFLYGGIEFKKEVYDIFMLSGSKLAPNCDFINNDSVTTIKKIRPLYDFLLLKNKKNMSTLFKDLKVQGEIFSILNHPLTLDFLNTFFLFLDKNKINSKSFTLLNFNFSASLGREFDDLVNSALESEFYKILNQSSIDLFTYEAGALTNEYLIKLKNTDFFNLLSKEVTQSFIDYNLLYPYHVLKSIKGLKVASPKINEVKPNLCWKVVF